MPGVRAFLPSIRALLQVAILLLMFAMASGCKSATDSGCDSDPEINECD